MRRVADGSGPLASTWTSRIRLLNGAPHAPQYVSVDRRGCPHVGQYLAEADGDGRLPEDGAWTLEADRRLEDGAPQAPQNSPRPVRRWPHFEQNWASVEVVSVSLQSASYGPEGPGAPQLPQNLAPSATGEPQLEHGRDSVCSAAA